jgi:hypothetical protein
VADICGFRQSGRAGGVNQQRTIGDRHRAAFGRNQRFGRAALDRAVDALEAAAVAVRPNLRAAHELRGGAFKLPGALGGDDDMLRRDDVDAMGERMPAQLGVDQRNDNARAGQAKPDRQIFGPVRHHQADGFVFGQSLIERPVRVAIGAFDKRAICQAFAADRQGQCVCIALHVRKFRDHVIEQALRIGGDRRCPFERPDPVAQRAVIGSHRRPRRFRFDRPHQTNFAELNESFAATALRLSERGRLRAARPPRPINLTIRLCPPGTLSAFHATEKQRHPDRA